MLERGLTSAGDTSETTAGSITVGSPDGLTSVKIGGLTLTVAQLQALSGSPQVIDTGEGTLTLTGFSGTGSAPLSGVISYTYTLKAALNQPGATESSDLIALEVTDRGGITTTGTLTVQIVDDTPTANADANSVADGTTSADSTVTGNVFSGSTPDVADRLGADTRANPVTAVSFGGAPQTVGSEFTTAYGHLTLNADGSYSYRLDNTNAAVNALKTGETLSETFTYTITDADGDPSTTTLTLTINGTTDGGPSIVPVDGNAGATGQASVLERGLTGPGDTSETTVGTHNCRQPGRPDQRQGRRRHPECRPAASAECRQPASHRHRRRHADPDRLQRHRQCAAQRRDQLHLHPESRAEPARRERKQRPDRARSHRPRRHHDDRHAHRPDRRRHPDRQRRRQQRHRRHDQRRQHRPRQRLLRHRAGRRRPTSAPTPGPTRSPPSASAAPRRPSAANSPPPTATSPSTPTAATATVWTTRTLRSTP